MISSILNDVKCLFILYPHRGFSWHQGLFEEACERGPLPETSDDRHLALLPVGASLPPKDHQGDHDQDLEGRQQASRDLRRHFQSDGRAQHWTVAPQSTRICHKV